MTSQAQALSDRHKEAVKSWVPKVRTVIEQDFGAQLERLGLKPSGEHTPLGKMTLRDEARVARKRAEAFLAREVMAEGTAERGFANVLREFYLHSAQSSGGTQSDGGASAALPAAPHEPGRPGRAHGSCQSYPQADALPLLARLPQRRRQPLQVCRGRRGGAVSRRLNIGVPPP